MRVMLPQDPWRPSPRYPVLDSGEVHVWRVCLNQPSSTVQVLSDSLTPNEKQRAAKYYFQKDREHFAVARGALREILSRYVSILPDRIRFSCNDYGKPLLTGPTGDHLLRFNVSHSNGVALYALTRGRDIGVDVEFMRQEFASLGIAELFFSPLEVSMLRALPPNLQTPAFFNCWTRKEAYVKARGEGLSHPLHRFAVSLVPGEPASLLSTDDDPLEASRWSLTELCVGPNYVAAIAVEGPTPTLHHWQLFS